MINQASLQPNATHGHPFVMSALEVYCQFTRGISPANNTGLYPLYPVLFTVFLTNLNEDTEGIIINNRQMSGNWEGQDQNWQ